MGRPTKYDPSFVDKAKALADNGATDREIAQALGVSERTLYLWKHEFLQFSQALKIGKDRADDRVEMALYRKATGYSFDAEKIFQHQGEAVRVDYVEHVPPSDTAAIFWLKNRRPGEWREKVDHAVNLDGDTLAAVMKVIDGKSRGLPG